MYTLTMKNYSKKGIESRMVRENREKKEEDEDEEEEEEGEEEEGRDD